MPTSELSDALNPYASQGRHRLPTTEFSPDLNSTVYESVVSLHQQHVPHVSELQMAVAEPSARPIRPKHPAQVVAELYRRVAATQSAHEAEQQRRLAWEQEQEAKFSLRQAEIEKSMLEMVAEIKTLRATVNSLTLQQAPMMHGLPTPPQYTTSPALSQLTAADTLPSAPVSPISQSSSLMQPMFVQGSSNNAIPYKYSSRSSVSVTAQTFSPQMYSQFQRKNSPPLSTELVALAMTTDLPSASPGSPKLTGTSPAVAENLKRKKRRKKSYSSEDEDVSTSSSSSRMSSSRKKRISHHDTKCYTIQHAVRLHISKMMGLETDKQLPDSHTEGTQLHLTEPIRFVWEKTTKQSVHNARMKTRILEDIKEKRQLYKNVSSKDFTKKVLDSAFEQCFVTLRQKFKIQRDVLAASHMKKREDGKARKARHLSRRKIKLNNRAEARNKNPVFEHVTFDGALQLDCMSSEESDNEMDAHSSQPFPYLKTRGYAWRSSRLLQFYYILDEEERTESCSKPKRGQGKKERRVGPNKEEYILPPQGVATWMISRRWYRNSSASHPDLPYILDKLLVKPMDFDWKQFQELGEESADEDVPQQHLNTMLSYNPEIRDMSISVPPQHHESGIYMKFAL